MMKKILFVSLLVIVAFCGFAQMPTIPGHTNINAKYQWSGGRFVGPFGMPVQDTGTVAYIGQQTLRPQDSLVYYAVSTSAGTKRWKTMGTGAGGTSSDTYTSPLQKITGTVSIKGLSGFGTSGQQIRSTGSQFEYFTPHYLTADSMALFGWLTRWPLRVKDSAIDILEMQPFSGLDSGYMTPGLWALKQNTVSLTTTGTSGAATFNSTTGVLNVPNYGLGAGGVTTLNTLTGATQTFATGTTGTDFNISSSGTTHTFHFPTVSGTNRGAVTPTLYNTWNAKEVPLSFSTGLTRASDVITWNGSQVRKNSTGSTFTRRRLNFIEGTGVTMTIADDSGSDEIDITINSTATGTGDALLAGNQSFTGINNFTNADFKLSGIPHTNNITRTKIVVQDTVDFRLYHQPTSFVDETGASAGLPVVYSSAGNYSIASASAMRSTLGLVIGTNVQAYDADLTTYAGITPSANVQTLLGSASYSAFRTSLGVAIGSDVQAFDADLSALAALSGTNTIYYRSAANTWTGVTIGTNLTFSGGTLSASSGASATANELVYGTGSSITSASNFKIAVTGTIGTNISSLDLNNTSGSGIVLKESGTITAQFYAFGGEANLTSIDDLRFAIGSGDKVYIAEYASGNTAPTTSGTKHMLTVDANGMLSHETIPSGGGGSGTVTDFVFTNGGGFTGSVGTSTTIPTLSLTLQNAAADGSTKGQSTFTAADFNASTGVISIDYTNGQAATSGQKGFLTSADWSTFNGKQAALNITANEIAYGNGASGITSNSSFVWSASGIGTGINSFNIDGSNGAGLLMKIGGLTKSYVYHHGTNLKLQSEEDILLLATGNDISIQGASTALYLDFSNTAAVFNEGGADRDFRIEGDANANLFFLDASADEIRIGTATDNGSYQLQVAGASLFSGTVTTANDASIISNGGISMNRDDATNVNGLLLKVQTGSTFTAPTTASQLIYAGASGILYNHYNGSDYAIVQKSSTVADNTIDNGETTPTATSVSNCSSSSATPAQWHRSGHTVTVSGTVTTTVTTASTLTIIDLSFPVTSAITDFYQCIGWAMTGSNVIHGSVQGNTTNDRAQIIFTPSTTGSQVVSYQYTYRIK